MVHILDKIVLINSVLFQHKQLTSSHQPMQIYDQSC